LAKQPLEPEVFYAGAWHPVPVYGRDGVEISRGARGEGQEAPPSEARVTADNRTGDWNPFNPTSPLYGVAGRNAPLRLSLDGVVRSTTEAASWAPQRSLGATVADAWTPITGGGIMRRLSQGNTPLRSPAYRALSAPENDAARVAYWPLEEESSATTVASLEAGGAVNVTLPVSFGGDDDSASSDRLAVLGDGGALQFPVPTYASSEHKVICLFRVPAAGLVDLQVMLRVECQGGTIDRFELVFSTGFGLRIPFYSGDTVVETLGPVAWSNSISGGVEWFSSIECTQSGGNIGVLHLIVKVPDGNTATASDTVVGHTLGRITRITAYGDGLAIGQLAVGNDTGAFPNYISPTNGSLGTRGYSGEAAGLRAIRLGEEEGVPVTWIGDPADSQDMGPQPALPFLDLLRECARTDDALMFEPVDALEVAIRGGRDLYNLDPVLTLDFDGGGVAHPLAPVMDDRGTRNDVTAKRRGGGQYRAVQLTGPLNVNSPLDDPDGVGRYDTQVEVNTATDDVLVNHAHWLLHRGTVADARYPSITVDLDAAPALTAAVEAVDIGDRIRLDNLPSDWAQEAADLVVLGISETIGTHRRRVTFNTVPARAWEVGIVGDAAGATYDLRGAAVDTDLSTLAGALTNSATSFGVNTDGDLEWTTDAADWNPAINGTGPWGGGLFIVVGGEVMRVTSISGTGGGTQTFNVVRSINGVVKAHAFLDAVHAAHPIRVGM